MVDISGKSPTVRRALATGFITLNSAALTAIGTGSTAKGDVLATARIAGIMAAKRTAELIPLCHPLPLSSAEISIDQAADRITISAEIRTTATTGVEMEALTAVSVALLTVYDMAKALDKSAEISGIHLLEKDGGKSGPWRAGGPHLVGAAAG